VSKFKDFLRTSSAGHLAVVLIRGDCVYWTFLMWEKLLLDFFKVGQNAAGLSNYWTNELHSLQKTNKTLIVISTFFRIFLFPLK
jgi:hypothetical protein